jgi:probable rRNA maturation factor
MGPTNVISFPMRGGEFSHLNPNLLGDVVISADTCAAEAQYGRLTFTQRLDQLIVHGILHLFGYDHINNPKKARLMARKSAELLSLIEGPTTTDPRMRKRLVRTKNSP